MGNMCLPETLTKKYLVICTIAVIKDQNLIYSSINATVYFYLFVKVCILCLLHNIFDFRKK